MSETSDLDALIQTVDNHPDVRIAMVFTDEDARIFNIDPDSVDWDAVAECAVEAAQRVIKETT